MTSVWSRDRETGDTSEGRGVPLACSKPDPVAIRLMANKTPCPNFEIKTEFYWLAYSVITTNVLNVLWSFSALYYLFMKVRGYQV